MEKLKNYVKKNINQVGIIHEDIDFIYLGT